MTASTARLSDLLAPVVEKTGADLENVDVSKAGKRSVVRVVVDRDGGVSMDDVADVSRAVSEALDALDEAVLRSMSDTPVAPSRILAGIDAAAAAGLRPVKVNMVVRRGVNEDSVPAMAEYFRGRREVLRFIEYMDVGSTNGWRMQEVVPAQEILATIASRWPLERLPQRHAGEVATRYRYLDGGGEIGLIHSVSEPFCGSCDRLRLTADGHLRTCLFALDEHDLRGPLRAGAADEEIAGIIRRAVAGKWAGHRIGSPDFVAPARSMSQIGG